MSPSERRHRLFEVLCLRRYDTYDNLSFEFHVSRKTISRDIAILMCSYPIETTRGYGGGVRIADGYYLNHKPSCTKALNPKQTAVLRKVRKQLTGDERDTLDSILIQFAP